MQPLIDKAKNIRLAIFDVDGVLTTGALFYGKDKIEGKNFHVHDGQGIKSLQKSGVEIAVITARTSDIVTWRMQDLGITHVYQGQTNKLIAYEALKQKLKLNDAQIAYAGDDLPDLSVLSRVGFSITVANAPLVIRQRVAWVTRKKGGKGAVREICDFIMEAQGTLQKTIEAYLT
ncbi:hypothetical protein AYO45_02590 [Gammaproteobacteria bacterium SCGC AG-212-F23]|nr:hypothetical protein AYO45_02590 [Gammaproteobacteria bacterium SCGC AG-212-F23]